MLHTSIACLAGLKNRSAVNRKLILKEYPFDEKLLGLSALYQTSRKLYLKNGGIFEATLTSSARTLSSPILVENRIEYTPLQTQIVWAATDKIEKRSPQSLAELRKFISSVFHEQNHRILWRLLPPAPKETAALRRYLNFAEALVIVMDMALADELGTRYAPLFNRVGVIFDPGTSIREKKIDRRGYRNYLQACLYATYLHLELFDPDDIAAIVSSLYQNAGSNLNRAILRAGRLNRGFIARTNLVWQKKHRKLVQQALGAFKAGRDHQPLELQSDPTVNFQQYLWAEKWFDCMGV